MACFFNQAMFPHLRSQVRKRHVALCPQVIWIFISWIDRPWQTRLQIPARRFVLPFVLYAFEDLP
jgi:hypothetical protein